MKQKQTISIFSLLVLAIIHIGCKKYLDAKQDSKLVLPSAINDLQALLDNANTNTKTPVWDEASADDYFLTQTIYNARSLKDRQAYTWELEDYNYPNDWSATYELVYSANIVLENIVKINRTAQNSVAWDNVKGSALFFRANAFLKAAWIFSKAYDESSASSDYGIVIRTTSDYNVPSTRSSVKDTYNKIIADLMEALPLLPDNPQHVMRPSKAAVYGVLARTYLSMRKYDSAYKYADLSLQIKNQLLDYNAFSTTAPLPIPSFNAEVIFHTVTSAYTFFNVIPTFARVDTVLFQSYASNDLRKDLFFAPNATTPPYRQFKGTYSGTVNFLFNGIATDEMYLVRAECLARAGDTTRALNDLNKLMIKRWKNNGSFVPFTATSSQDALNKILTERRKELVFRGLRWSDIKRLNKEGANISLKRFINNQTYTLPPNDNRYALALPADIISLTGMPQNIR